MYVPPGGTGLQVATFTLPAGMVAGNYSLQGVVDSANDLAETNEGNNTFLSPGQYAVSGGLPVLTADVSTNAPAAGMNGTTTVAPPVAGGQPAAPSVSTMV